MLAVKIEGNYLQNVRQRSLGMVEMGQWERVQSTGAAVGVMRMHN